MHGVPDLHPSVITSILDKSLLQRRNPAHAARLVLNRGLRDRTLATRHVLAAYALKDGTWDSVSQFANQYDAPALAQLAPESAPWWHALGQIVLVHAESAREQQLAVDFFAVAQALDKNVPTSLLEYWSALQAVWNTRGADSFDDLPPAPRWIPPIENDLTVLDVIAAQEGRGSSNWLAHLNARIFDPHTLAHVTLRSDESTLFDQLHAEVSTTVDSGPMISVVMTTFRRTVQIATSIRSILAQSWTNLEVLVVDDGSGPEFEPGLLSIERIDPRVRVIRQPANLGTYAARNRALQEVRGEFVTFQDDDDWSHPQRLERQVAPMLKDPFVHSTLSHCVRASEDLQFRNSPVPASRKNSSSLMFRTQDIALLGGFDTVRKGADTEFITRMSAVLPGRLVMLKQTLALIRFAKGSLSRSDFGPGWSHPARQEYWESSEWWQGQYASVASPPIDAAGASRSFPAPRRFLNPQLVDAMRSSYDVILVGNFGSNTPWASQAWNWLRAASDSNMALGIIHLSDPTSPSARITRIAPEVRRLIQTGEIDRILPTDQVHAQSLVITDAALIELQDTARWNLSCSQATLVASSCPVESGAASMWSVKDVASNFDSMFGVADCLWVATDRDVYKSLTDFGVLCDETLVSFFITADAIAVAQRRPGAIPVIGRCVLAGPEGWPGDSDSFRAAYPGDSSVDVRLFGETHSVKGAGHRISHHWLIYPSRAENFASFIQQLDFYVYFGDAPPSTHEHQVILATIAAGRIVIVEARHASAYGDMVVSCTAETVASVIADVHHDQAAYSAQVSRALTTLRSDYSPDSARAMLTSRAKTGIS